MCSPTMPLFYLHIEESVASAEGAEGAESAEENEGPSCMQESLYASKSVGNEYRGSFKLGMCDCCSAEAELSIMQYFEASG